MKTQLSYTYHQELSDLVKDGSCSLKVLARLRTPESTTVDPPSALLSEKWSEQRRAMPWEFQQQEPLL